MDQEKIKNINDQIYKRFPFLDGILPAQENLPDGELFLRYSANQLTANGMSLPITVKVRISGTGEITQITTSK